MALAVEMLDTQAFYRVSHQKIFDAILSLYNRNEKADVITFRDGLFHSSTCDQYGYSSAPYVARSESGAIAFEAETKSDKDGRLVWRGTVRGQDIEGTMLHYKKGFFGVSDTPNEMWFKGRVKS